MSKKTTEVRAEDVFCPECHAAYGETCTYRWEGQIRKRFEPHYERLVRARYKARENYIAAPSAAKPKRRP